MAGESDLPSKTTASGSIVFKKKSYKKVYFHENLEHMPETIPIYIDN